MIVEEKNLFEVEEPAQSLDVEELNRMRKKQIEYGEFDFSEEAYELNDKKSRQVARILKIKHEKHAENGPVMNKMAPYVLQVAIGIHAVILILLIP